jgi:steroid 5-alpha reductase family enzyme
MTISYLEALVGIWSLRLGPHFAIPTAGISDDPLCRTCEGVGRRRIAGEGLADAQPKRFRTDPANRGGSTTSEKQRPVSKRVRA